MPEHKKKTAVLAAEAAAAAVPLAATCNRRLEVQTPTPRVVVIMMCGLS
jgi:hypothetical protein